VFREIDSLRVAGKTEPVRVFELVGEAEAVGAERLAQVAGFETGLAAYRDRDWDAAEKAFSACLAADPDDRPSQVYLERIAAFRAAPPGADWDGVWVATGK
jgi:adenylate cyclase